MVDSGTDKMIFGLKLNIEKIPKGDGFWRFDLTDGFCMNAWSFVINA